MIATRTHRRHQKGEEPYVAEILLTRAELDRLVRNGEDALSDGAHRALFRLLAEVDAHEADYAPNGTPKPHLRTIFAGVAKPPTVRPTEGLAGGCR